MKFTPKTDEELERSTLLDPGVYDFEVMTAEETISKAKGNPMIAVKLRIFSDRGERHVYDYLLESMAFKFKHIAEIAGFYERGEVTADDLIGVAGKVELEIQEGNNGYKAKNSVVDYISPKKMGEMMTPKATKQALEAPVSFDDDDIPF